MICVGRGMASLVHREGDGTFGGLCSPPGTALALHFRRPVTIPMGRILLRPLPGGFACSFKTEKNPQVLFESLLTQLEGVIRNLHFAT